MPDAAVDQQVAAFDADAIRYGANWIEYPRAEEILRQLETLLTMRRHHRMPNLVIAGPTNNGKTSIVRRFCANHVAELRLTPGERSSAPVLLIEVPEKPDVNALYNDVLTQLSVPFRPSAPLDQRRRKALQFCRDMQVQMLIFDELHHIAVTTPTKQREILQMMKYLGNQLMIPIVAVGTREAFNAIKRDPQLANRFDPALLPRWTLNGEYLSLLATFDELLPAGIGADLTSEPVARSILSQSGGTIGEISRVVAAAAQYALRTGSSAIDCHLIESCGYVSEDKRNRVEGID